MAVKRQEMEVLPPGTRADRMSKGPYLQNMERFGQHWRTRKGFGQVGQFDSTFGMDAITYNKHMGSTIIKTNFGHEQILSAFSVTVFTGNFYNDITPAPSLDRSRDVGQTIDCFLVTIYDLTTDEVWEELIYPKTAQDTRDIIYHHGLYETTLDTSYEAYLSASSEEFFFEEFDDTVYFGNRRAGLLAYYPSVFHEAPRNQQLAGAFKEDWYFRGYSESSLIVRTAPQDGIHSEGYEYLTSAEFPAPSDIAILGRRMVFIDGRDVYFSDVGRPMSVIGLNRVTIPSQNDAVAIAELHGNLIIFTESERFLYQPTFFEGLISAGDVLVSSTEIGIVGPNALRRVGGNLVWVDRTGLYSTSNGYDSNDISANNEIKDFWRKSVEVPLTQYFQNVANPGSTTLAYSQPSMQYQFDPTGCHIVFDHTREAMIVAFPAVGMAWVWGENVGPSVWTFESVAASTAQGVRSWRNITNPWFLMGQDNLFLVGSSDDVTAADGTAASTESKRVGSFYVLEYERGGGPDRTLDYGVTDVFMEDDRRIAGKYYNRTPASVTITADNVFYLEPWMRMPNGWKPPNSGTGLLNVYLVPVALVPNPGAAHVGPDNVDLIFTFDRTKWAPVLRPASTEVDFLLPSERINGAAGWGMGAPVAGTREVQIYAGGVPNAVGNEVRIRFDGNLAGYAGPIAPYLGLNHGCMNRILYLPFQYAGLVIDDVFSMGIGRATLATHEDAGGTPYAAINCQFLAWGQGHTPGIWKTADEDVQPVDWVVRTSELTLTDTDGNPTPDGGLMARSLYVRMRSHGKGTTLIYSSSVFGLLNAAVGSDWKGWTSQVVDYVGDIPSFITDLTSIRSRMKDSAGAMRPRTFGGVAKWGDQAVAASGDYLIDSEEVDTIVFSDSVRGETLFWMLFGHIRNRAEEVAIESMTAEIVRRGGRRRIGR
jgi:hypothetical protein